MSDRVEPKSSRSSTTFQPGQSGNPAGRTKGSRDVRVLLAEAIEKAQARRTTLQEPCSCSPDDWARSCTEIDEHFIRRAFHNDNVLVALQKKRIPDLQHQTGDAARVVNIIRMDKHGTDRP